MNFEASGWRCRLGLIATAAGVSLLGSLAMAPATHATDTSGGASCPAAESLVPGAAWSLQQLAPGVRIYEASIYDDRGRGQVKMHVLRIDVTHRGVSVKPLMHSLAERTPLTQLANGHPQLVAAVNTGYFDFVSGAPTQPLIVDGKALVLSARPQHVVGFDAKGRLQWGSISLSADVLVGAKPHPVHGLNDIAFGGVEAFNAAWGTSQIPDEPTPYLARSVVGDRLGSTATRFGDTAAVPVGGWELVAHGRTARWLEQLPAGTLVHLSNTVASTAPHPFVQAYGVGTTIVQDGVGRTGLSCASAGTKQPARTAIGIADNGKTLVIGEVEDHPGTKIHGLDEDQMGKFMEQLGVDRAWDLDGSGSTELLARMPGTTALSLRTYPADGEERPMPVGLGITYLAPAHSQSGK